jgi:lipopolysaccharide transport system permease protein
MSEAALERRPGVDASDLDEHPVTVIKPPPRWPRLDLRELWRHRSVCFVLARRNLMVRYRQTMIGAAWAVIQPVSLMIVFTAFFGVLARVPSQGIPYPVFFLSGLVIWQMVNKILNEGSTSVVANATLVSRVYFPRAYFPISVALASLVDLVFGLLALAVVLVIFGTTLGPVWLIPILILIAWITGLGVALALSAINTTYRDVTQLLPFLSQLWMFASPIIYPSTIIPESVRWLYYFNPLALVIDGFRHAVANTPPPGPEAWLVGVPISMVILVGGYLVFRKREPTFADVV